MRKMLIASMLVLLVLVMGCAKQEAPAEEPMPTAEPQVEVEVSEPESEAVQTAGSEILSAISCNRDAKVLTFTITNIDDKDWYLEKVSAFDIAEKTPAKISMNGRVMNDADVICAANILEPGEDVECEKEYDDALFARTIRLKDGDLGKLDYNTLRIQTPDFSEVVEFDC